MITNLELSEARRIAKSKEPKLWQKRRLIQLLLKLYTNKTRPITTDEESLGFKEAFEAARDHFLNN